MKALHRGHFDFEPSSIQTAVDRYWQAAVRERIVRKDFRRSWDYIKNAKRGYEMDGMYEYPASPRLLEDLISELHSTLREMELVPSLMDPAFVPAPPYDPEKGYSPSLKIAGLQFARDIGGVDDRWVYSLGKKTIAIATYVNTLTREKKKRQMQRKVAHKYGA
jgi:hypothetical protein